MSLPSLYRPTIERKAHAKVNLALAVGAAREDGMHPIASWMAPVDLADDLMVTRLEDDRLSRYAILWHPEARKQSPIDWSITKDLSVRAHLLLEEAAGRSLPVQMKLVKRIPVGGGLGGGSSDAAAMLLAVRELFELELDDDALREIAMKLGSDVGFFLDHGAAVVEGLGDRIERTAPVEGWMVLIVPPFGCATGSVYRAFDEIAPGESLRDEVVRAMAHTGEIESGALFNDLAAAAERVEPQLARVRKRAAEVMEIPVHITGSGSTMFAVCTSASHAAELAAKVEGALTDCAAIEARLCCGRGAVHSTDGPV